jgi:cysteine desulfurase
VETLPTAGDKGRDAMIYLDNAATTPVHPDVLAAMAPYQQDKFGNPSSIHAIGRAAKAALDKSRAAIASFVGAHWSEIVFTSGGTESIHAALLGSWLAAGDRKHIVTTAIEHHAVLHTCEFLRRLGAEVTVVPPREDGTVHVEDVLEAVRPDTCLVSMMLVNNETGAVLPVEDVARAVKQECPGVLVHSDMVQALGTHRVRLSETAIDLASFSAHKVYGPKGVGALYVRQGTRWQPVLHGGAQERERRAGTENVAGIVGFGAAVERLEKSWEAHLQHLTAVRDAFWKRLRETGVAERNSPEDAVPTILNVWFPGVKNETMLMRLDMEHVAASAGSACTAGSLEPSHVLRACGFSELRVLQSIRFSFSEFNTVEEVEQAADIAATLAHQLRR